MVHNFAVPSVVYNGPVGLLPELVDLLRNAGVDTNWTPPIPVVGCDTITTDIQTTGPQETFAAVAQWNDRYPPFGVHVEP
jgi:hypothetical protein